MIEPHHFYRGSFVLPNRQEISQAETPVRKPLQDHALVLAREGTVALAVADGVSLVLDVSGIPGPSHAQCGAVAAAEVAASAALGSETPDEVGPRVARALREALGPLARALGRRASLCLASTLLVGVITPGWGCVCRLGDGAFGLTVEGEFDLQTGPPAGSKNTTIDMPTEWGHYHSGRLHTRRLTTSVATLLADDGLELSPVVMVRGRVLHMWLATDGSEEELELVRLLKSPVRRRAELVEACARPRGCDDLAVAFASEPQFGGVS